MAPAHFVRLKRMVQLHVALLVLGMADLTCMGWFVALQLNFLADSIPQSSFCRDAVLHRRWHAIANRLACMAVAQLMTAFHSRAPYATSASVVLSISGVQQLRTRPRTMQLAAVGKENERQGAAGWQGSRAKRALANVVLDVQHVLRFGQRRLPPRAC